MIETHAINHVGISALHRHIDGLVANTVANAYWKDQSGKYLGANDWQVKRFGLDSPNHLIHASDNDLLTPDSASFITQNDKQVALKEQALLILEPLKLLRSDNDMQGMSHYLSYKSPLLNQFGKVIGVFGLSYLIDDTSDNDKMINEISMIGGYHTANAAQRIIYRNDVAGVKLTQRQINCLELLAKGMTMREIGEALSLSSRTIEHYIETIKTKLDCTTRADLFRKASALGLLE